MSENTLKILIISRDLSHRGGVVDTVRLLLAKLSGKAGISHFRYGRRPEQGSLAGYLQPFRDLASLFRKILEQRYDVIHVNPSLNARSFCREAAALFLLRICGYRGKVLVFFHGWDPAFFKRITNGFFLSRVFLWLLSTAGRITVLSSAYRNNLIESGLPAEKVHLASSMFERDAVASSGKKFPEAPVILFMSRLVAGKGGWELLESFKSIAADYPDARLVFAGEGPLRQSLEAEVEKNGLANVSFAGHVTGGEKKKLLEEAHVFVLPTKYSEGCPVSLLEAMASGLVSVVPLAGGIADIVEPGFSAVALPEISPDSITSGIEQALSDKAFFEKMSDKAREVAFTHYESETVSESVFELYRLIAEGN